MKKVAILQSNYIPWKGYFDLIAAVDEFIIYDDMQYTRRDWRNRNIIKTSQGLQWLTVPVVVKGKYFQKICETRIEESNWASNHWRSIEVNYRKSMFFDEISAWLKPLYDFPKTDSLSTLNRQFIEGICKYLEITTTITNSWDYEIVDGKSERLVSLCIQSGATEYISGPAAKAYINPFLFEENKITLHWFDYSDYPIYPQKWGGFEHGVTIIDLLFNCGKESYKYMKFLRK